MAKCKIVPVCRLGFYITSRSIKCNIEKRNSMKKTRHKLALKCALSYKKNPTLYLKSTFIQSRKISGKAMVFIRIHWKRFFFHIFVSSSFVWQSITLPLPDDVKTENFGNCIYFNDLLNVARKALSRIL